MFACLTVHLLRGILTKTEMNNLHLKCTQRRGIAFSEMAEKAPLRIVVTGAAGQIAYSLLYQVDGIECLVRV